MYTFQQNSSYNDPQPSTSADPLFQSHFIPTQSANLLSDNNAYSSHPTHFANLDPSVDLSAYGALEVSNDNNYFVANGSHPGYPDYPAPTSSASQHGQSSHLGSGDLLNVHSHVPPTSLLHQQVDSMHYAYTHVQEPSVTALTHGHMHAPDASRSSSHGLHVPVSPPDASSVNYSAFFTGYYPERDLSAPSVAPEVGELGSAADNRAISPRRGGPDLQLPGGHTDHPHFLSGWGNHLSEQSWNGSSGVVYPSSGDPVTLPQHLTEVGRTSSDHAADPYYMQTDWIPQQYSTQHSELFYTSDTAHGSHQQPGFFPSSFPDSAVDQRNMESSLVQPATATSLNQGKSITAEANLNATRSTSANEDVSLCSVSASTESGITTRGSSMARIEPNEFDLTTTNDASSESRFAPHEILERSASASSSGMESSRDWASRNIEKMTNIGSQVDARDNRVHTLRTEVMSDMPASSGGETSTSADYSWPSDTRNHYTSLTPASPFTRPTAPIPPELHVERHKRSQTSMATRRVLHGDSALQNATPSKPPSLSNHSTLSSLTSAMNVFPGSSSSQAPASPSIGEFAALPPQQHSHGAPDSGTAHAERLRARQAAAQGNAQITLANERVVLERFFASPPSHTLSSQSQRGQQQQQPENPNLRPPIQRSHTENSGLQRHHVQNQGQAEISQGHPFATHSIAHTNQPTTLATDLQEARSIPSNEGALATSFSVDVGAPHMGNFTPQMTSMPPRNTSLTQSETSAEDMISRHTSPLVSGSEPTQVQAQQRSGPLSQQDQQQGLRPPVAGRNSREAIIEFDRFVEPTTPASAASAASAPGTILSTTSAASKAASAPPAASPSRPPRTSSPGADSIKRINANGVKVLASEVDTTSPPGVLPSGHLTENVQVLTGEDMYDGRSHIPDFVDMHHIPVAPPGARMGDCPEIMAVRPHPLEVPGQRYHMLLHPEGDKIPHGYTVDDLKNLSGGLGKDGKPRLKLNTEKKSPPKMACHFCRNRKIACGTGKGKDKTCNQCERRGLQCSFPTESRRGMRIRRPKNTHTAEEGAGQQKDSGRDQNEEEEETGSEHTECEDPMPISAGGNSTGVSSPVDRSSKSPIRQNKKQKLSSKSKGKNSIAKTSKGKGKTRLADDASNINAPYFERTMDFDMVDVSQEGESMATVASSGELRLPEQLNTQPDGPSEDRIRFSKTFEIRNSSSSLAGALEMPQDTEMATNTERRSNPPNTSGRVEEEPLTSRFTEEQLDAIAPRSYPFFSPLFDASADPVVFNQWASAGLPQTRPHDTSNRRRFSLPDVGTQQNPFAQHGFEHSRHSLDHQMDTHFNPSGRPSPQSQSQQDVHMTSFHSFPMDQSFASGSRAHEMPSPSFSAQSTPSSLHFSSVSPALSNNSIATASMAGVQPSTPTGVVSVSSVERSNSPLVSSSSAATQGGAAKRRSPFTTTPLKIKDMQKRPGKRK